MRHLALFLVALAGGSMLSGMTAHGAIYFADNFGGPTFGPNLVDIDSKYFFSGGKAGTNGPRSYVRTVESNYMSVDFQADLIYSIGGSGGAPGVFFGIGPATKRRGLL
jgi:hypothetical protein